MESFIDNLRVYGLGSLLPECEKLQKKITAAVMETGRTGKLTIDLTYKMVGSNVISVIPKLTPKIPGRTIRDSDMFFDDKTGNLHETDPRQINFDEMNVHRLPKDKKVNQI